MKNDTSRPGIVHKIFDPAEINFTPGEKSTVSYISTDCVDNEGDVVLASGVDWKSIFLKNPVVLACHNYQTWPVGSCPWIQLAKPTKSRAFNGLIAKTLFDEDPDALRLFGMVQRGIVRGQSIGFRPPDDMQPGEWGPPTKDELKARPEWETARRVIRRCVLLEYSFVPVPMNQESLVLAVSKGLKVPTFLEPAVSKAMSESSATSGGATVPPETKDDDGDSDDMQAKAIKAGDHVEWGMGRKGGCGKVVSVHKAGKVPGVDEDVEGSEDDPAAKVKVCKVLDNGKYAPTEKHMGHKVKDLFRIAHPMDEADDEKALEDLPAIPAFRTKTQVLAGLERKVRERFDPEAIAQSAIESALARSRGEI